MRKLRLVSLLGLAVLSCQEPEAPLAHMDSFTGVVTVRPQGSRTDHRATAHMGLFLDDVVTTGADGHATVRFVESNKVDLEPNSSLVIHRTGSTLAAFGVELLKGHMIAATGDGNFQLTILSRGNVVEVGSAGSVLDISIERGFEVKMGQADIVRGGRRQTLTVGRRLTLDGLISELGGTLDGVEGAEPVNKSKVIEVKPMVFVMLAKPQQVQVLAAGQSVWKPAQKRTSLKGGDRVRVKKGGGGTRVQFADDSALTFKGDSDVEFTEANRSAQGTAAAYRLNKGSVTASVRRQEGKTVEHTLYVAGTKVKVEPTLREGTVQAETTATGAQLWVRNGVATVNNSKVEAGSMVEISGGRVVAEHPLTATRIDIHTKANTIVYYDKHPPALNFVWAEPSANSTIVEVSTERDFNPLVCAEEVKRGSLIIDELLAGKYYWRLNRDNATQGVVQIIQESTSDCANCKRTNVIDDTGEKTVVYFQQALPALLLRWKEVEGAADYNLKVFSDGEFDKPLFSEKVKDLRRSFESGRFPEGKYYWLVVAFDDKGRELATGRMNSLQVAYDNAITALVIRTPHQSQQVSGTHVITAGEAELGAKVFINGKRIEVDDAGRFSEAVALKAGANQIVYRAATSDGVERYYLRDVMRR